MDNPINNMMDASLESIRKTADANTVIGDPIVTADGTTVIPISRIKIGFAGGGSEFSGKHAGESKPYGAGTGASISVTPVAFLIFREGSCRVLPIPEPASNSVDRLIEQIPDAVDKIAAMWNERKGSAENV